MLEFLSPSRTALARLLKQPVCALIAVFGLLIIISAILVASYHRLSKKKHKPRLVWGTAPIISLAYMSQALKLAGYSSEVIVTSSSSIYPRTHFDCIITVSYPFLLGRFIGSVITRLRAYYFFARALIKFDIFHYFFDAGILQSTFLAKKELSLLKLAGKKLILMPYGADSFVFDTLNPYWRHGLLMHYPRLGDDALHIQATIRKRTQLADCIIACLVHFINLPRWDILPVVYYPGNLEVQPSYPRTTGPIRIAHAPNHRGIKGTEFLLQAIHQLQMEGHDIILEMIEKKPHDEAIRILSTADIVVDQLIFGYALAAIEGFALGKVVISGIQDTSDYTLFRHYSYLNECPIIPASVTNIYRVLKQLIKERYTWPNIGKKSRKFAEKRHSPHACNAMFTAIYEKIWYRKEIDLINFYHPLLSTPTKARSNQTGDCNVSIDTTWH